MWRRVKLPVFARVYVSSTWANWLIQFTNQVIADPARWLYDALGVKSTARKFDGVNAILDEARSHLS